MSWIMPPETARHDRIWMAFPREGLTLGEGEAYKETGYQAWTEVAHAIGEFEPVSMVVDPSEMARARRMLGSHIEIVEAPLDEFWMRDFGPTFVVDPARPGVLGAVSWVFNGWGANAWATWEKSAAIAPRIAAHVGAELVTSPIVNEGGGIHVDGEGTVLVTETVQLDPRRNPTLTKADVEAELIRTLGVTKVIWLPRGLTRDYEEFGTNGHVDIVATFAAPGQVLVHRQPNADHPDHAVMAEIRALLSAETDAKGRPFAILDLDAPETIADAHGFVDYSYVNHLVVNDGVVACGFGDDKADASARAILEAAYPGRRVVTIDSRPIFARGGGIHCITQQQPALGQGA
ncbi:agmatine deiminase [Rhizobium sp. RU20A]|uniref:agmatine deiminase family protein n=1 Tax=Rhizobium sp. RU20A TaxID=1907412 RepID=UPI000955B736|nr:agmatine deiminase family protein [Rhizobium sp. RU20A]SIQ85981.1 agmatine deiminase [Rhizobium sp. RU20A]